MRETLAAASNWTPVRTPRAEAFAGGLRPVGIFERGHSYSFPRDAAGCVDIDRPTEQVRSNCFYARSIIGRALQ